MRLREQGTAGRPGGDAEAEGGGVSERRELRLECADCGHVLAEPAVPIRIDGAHEHTFANPHGLVFTVRCYAGVDGCAGRGGVEHFWSWFPEYGWQIALCGGCGEHLGWAFVGEESAFHGLVAARVTEA